MKKSLELGEETELAFQIAQFIAQFHQISRCFCRALQEFRFLPHQAHGARPAADVVKTLFLMPDAGNSAAPYR